MERFLKLAAVGLCHQPSGYMTNYGVKRGVSSQINPRLPGSAVSAYPPAIWRHVGSRQAHSVLFLKKIAPGLRYARLAVPPPLRQLLRLPLGIDFLPPFSRLRRCEGCFLCTRYTFRTSHRLKTPLATLRANLGHRLPNQTSRQLVHRSDNTSLPLR